MRPEAFASNNLDAMRALAAGAVFAHHAMVLTGARVPFFGPHGGWFGIELFFLISGYLISRSHEVHPLKAYVWHRVLRIMPAYLAFYLVFGVLRGALSWERIAAHPDWLLVNLLQMQHFHPRALLEMDALSVTRTLTIEVLWYAAVPFVAPLMRRAPYATTIGAAVLSTAWVLLSPIYVSPLYGDETRALMDGQFDAFFVTSAFPGQLIFFVLGALIYQQPSLIRLHPLTLVTTFLLAGVLFYGWGAWTSAIDPNGLTGLGVAAIVLLGLQSPQIESRLVRWFSDVSYSFYLVHMPALAFIGLILGIQGWTGAGLALVLALGTATVGFILFEQPFMRYARRGDDWRILLPTPLATLRFWTERRAPSAMTTPLATAAIRA